MHREALSKLAVPPSVRCRAGAGIYTRSSIYFLWPHSFGWQSSWSAWCEESVQKAATNPLDESFFKNCFFFLLAIMIIYVEVTWIGTPMMYFYGECLSHPIKIFRTRLTTILLSYSIFICFSLRLSEQIDKFSCWCKFLSIWAKYSNSVKDRIC